MNNSLLARNQQTLQKISLRSFFKLPLILVLFLFFENFTSNQILKFFIYHNDFNKENSLFHSFIVSIFGDFNVYLIYFVIAAVMLIHCKLYQVNKRTILAIFIMASFFIIISCSISLWSISLCYFIYDIVYAVDFYLNDVSYTRGEILREIKYPLCQYTNFILMIIKLFLLIFSIKIIGNLKFFHQSIHSSNRLIINHQQIFFALLFSALFLIIPLIILNSFVYSEISFYFRRSIGEDVSIYLSYLVPTLFIFEIITFQFIVSFFAVKDCFKRDFTEIPINLLLKSTAWSYLYLFVLGVIFYSDYSLHKLMVANFFAYEGILKIPIQLLYILLSFIASLLLMRKAIKKYFCEDYDYLDRIR